MPNHKFTFDARLNTTIEVTVDELLDVRHAHPRAKEIFERLVLTDPVTGKTYDLDLEDGLVVLSIENDDSPTAIERLNANDTQTL